MSLDYSGLPEHMQDGFRLYIEHGIELGSFGMAVVCNDLRRACECADGINRYRLWDIVCWLYNKAPAPCWGSPAKVKAWLASRQPGQTEEA